MSINLEPVDPNTPVKNAPAVINQNFTDIQTAINEILGKISLTENTLKLTNLTTVPNGGIEAGTIVLTSANGIIFAISPSGNTSVATIDNTGIGTFKSIQTTGTGDPEKSVLNTVEITESINIVGGAGINVDGILNLLGSATKVLNKLSIVNLSDSNFGASATNPVDLHLESVVALDFSAVTSTDGLNISTSNLAEGQVLEMHCLRTSNGNSQKIYNGTSGSEIFAYINPTGTGITTVSSLVLPEFTPDSNNTKSYIKARWTNIGNGQFRLLVIDSKNVTGVS